MLVLITRPEPDASKTAGRLREKGHEFLIASLLTLETVKSPDFPPGPFDGVALTSANAIRAASKHNAFASLLALPAYAVGAHTAEVARAAGFEKVTYSQGDAAKLAAFIREHCPRGSRILHLTGEHRAQDFRALLAPAGIEVSTCILYRMRAAASLPSDAVEAITGGKVGAVLHYSPRSAAVFVTVMERARLAGKLATLRHLCISQETAKPIQTAGVKTEIAAKPDENTLLSMI